LLSIRNKITYYFEKYLFTQLLPQPFFFGFPAVAVSTIFLVISSKSYCTFVFSFAEHSKNKHPFSCAIPLAVPVSTCLSLRSHLFPANNIGTDGLSFNFRMCFRSAYA
jgi:hypothetical protein